MSIWSNLFTVAERRAWAESDRNRLHAALEEHGSHDGPPPSQPQAPPAPAIQGVVFILRDAAGRVLMERCPKKAARHGAEWFIPGGRVEAGETVWAALNREMLEELGCYPVVSRSLPIIDACGGPAWPSFLMQPYLVTEWEGEAPKHTLDQPDVPLRWMDPTEALASRSAVVRAMLAAAGIIVPSPPAGRCCGTCGEDWSAHACPRIHDGSGSMYVCQACADWEDRYAKLLSDFDTVTTYVCPCGTAPTRACALCNPEPTTFAQGQPFTDADVLTAYTTGAREARDTAIGPPPDDLIDRAADAYVKRVHLERADGGVDPAIATCPACGTERINGHVVERGTEPWPAAGEDPAVGCFALATPAADDGWGNDDQALEIDMLRAYVADLQAAVAGGLGLDAAKVSERMGFKAPERS